MAQAPSIFISYSHSDKSVAVALNDALEGHGFRTWIDERELRIGDSIIERVATAVAEANYFLALVSASSVESQWCQKELHLAVTGELGREGVSVLPVRIGEVSMPAALRDVLYLDLDPDDVPAAAARIASDLREHAADTQKTAPTTRRGKSEPSEVATQDDSGDATDEPIRITGIVREGIGKPLNDGSAASALYRVPLRLSRRPSELWRQLFEREWYGQLYTMLRDAEVRDDTIVFPSTTIDEIERHHVGQLRRVLERVNSEEVRIRTEETERHRREAEMRKRQDEEHQASIDRVIERLSFDD
jgi:hypothetical protein